MGPRALGNGMDIIPGSSPITRRGLLGGSTYGRVVQGRGSTYIRMVQEHNVQAFHSPHLVADGKPRDRDRGSDAQTGRMVGVPIRSLSSSPALIGEPLPLDQSDSSERSRWS